MTADLAARIAEAAALIEGKLTADEAMAARNSDGRGLADGFPDYRTYVTDDSAAADDYIEHFGPARARRRVKSARDLVAAILAERHEHNPLEEYYACSQATAAGGYLNPRPEDLVPGSGCSDPERKGKLCDCGRDQRVARLLGIIASEWEGADA